MTKKAVEQTGLIPRSIIRTFDRFRKQLFPEAEKLVIQEFRISRYQFLVSIKCLLSLIFIPLTINFLLKNFLLIPLTENLWNNKQSEIFLNSYQQDQAFNDLKKFQEKLYFDYLINDLYIHESPINYFYLNKNNLYEKYTKNQEFFKCKQNLKYVKNCSSKNFQLFNQISSDEWLQQQNEIKKLVKKKIFELAVYYNHESVLALVNLISDFVTFLVITVVIIYMKPQISILKSFLTESIYSLNDTKKSFLLILGTDLLVGFHSPRGWEICLQLILRHFGLPENKDFVFLFVATFPVLLDTVFKYWVFRYLNKISPSTVATYHSMIE